MQEKDKNELFTTLLRTFPLPNSLENFSLRNKNILLRCLSRKFHPEDIIRCCTEIQKHFHKEKDGKIIFEICYKNICDYLFHYADEYYSLLDKLIFSEEFGIMMKVSDHTVFDSRQQNLWMNNWLNFITTILSYSLTNSFAIHITTSFRDLLNKHIDRYYHYEKLKLYKKEFDLQELYTSTKEKIFKELDIWERRIQEQYLFSNTDESLLITPE